MVSRTETGDLRTFYLYNVYIGDLQMTVYTKFSDNKCLYTKCSERTTDSSLTANEMLAADVRVGPRIVVPPVDRSKP